MTHTVNYRKLINGSRHGGVKLSSNDTHLVDRIATTNNQRSDAEGKRHLR